MFQSSKIEFQRGKTNQAGEGIPTVWRKDHSLPGRWRSGTTAPPLNTGRRFEPRRGRWRSEGWVLIPGGGFLAVERGAGGLELEDSAAFAFGGRQYLVTCTMPTRKED